MSDSTLSKTPSLSAVGYTTLAVVLSLVCRWLFMPQWSPAAQPSMGLAFLILWIMAVLPVLYLAFRRWADHSLESFMPQVFVFLTLSFAIQTALNAVSMGFGLMDIPHAALMPFVWMVPWLAITTRFKKSYTTAKQCKSILLLMVPTALVVHIMYLLLPAYALVYAGVGLAATTLFLLTALSYGTAAWWLNRTASHA